MFDTIIFAWMFGLLSISFAILATYLTLPDICKRVSILLWVYIGVSVIMYVVGTQIDMTEFSKYFYFLFGGLGAGLIIALINIKLINIRNTKHGR